MVPLRNYYNNEKGKTKISMGILFRIGSYNMEFTLCVK